MPSCSERQLSEQVRFLELFMLQFQELLSPFVEKKNGYVELHFQADVPVRSSVSAMFL